MMCEKCGKNLATTHIKTVINGTAEEHNLCSFCAAKEGYGSLGGFSLTNMLATMLGDGLEKGLSAKKRCDVCGSSFADIAQSGKVGCAECYKTFAKELEPSLNRLHGKVTHIGKTIKKVSESETKQQKIDKLKKFLKDAIEKEEFEKAAEIRDEIKKLEGREE